MLKCNSTEVRFPGCGQWSSDMGVQEGPETAVMVRVHRQSLYCLFLFLNTWVVMVGNWGFSQMNICTVRFMVRREPTTCPQHWGKLSISELTSLLPPEIPETRSKLHQEGLWCLVSAQDGQNCCREEFMESGWGQRTWRRHMWVQICVLFVSGQCLAHSLRSLMDLEAVRCCFQRNPERYRPLHSLC